MGRFYSRARLLPIGRQSVPAPHGRARRVTGRGRARCKSDWFTLTCGGAVSMIGTTVGSYEIRQRIGSTPNSVVYEAFDQRLRRPVALKFLQGSAFASDDLERFDREAKLLSQLNHPN